MLSHLLIHILKKNVETSVSISGELQVEFPTELVLDILMFDNRLDDTSSEDWSDVELHHVEVRVNTKNGKDNQPINTHVVNSYLNDILNGNLESNNELRNEDPLNEESKGQGEMNEKFDENDDVHIANIMKRIIKSVTKPQEKVVAKEVEDDDEETESDEAPDVKVMKSNSRSMSDRGKEKNKDVPPKTFIKNTKIVNKKTPKKEPYEKEKKG